MRISVRKDDPGYHPQAYMCEAFLNGEPVKGCFTADEEAGEVHVHEWDEAGKYIMDGDCLAEKVLKGTVLIIVPSNFRKELFNNHG